MEIIKESCYYRSLYFFKTEKKNDFDVDIFPCSGLFCFDAIYVDQESSIHISHHTFQITRIYS